MAHTSAAVCGVVSVAYNIVSGIVAWEHRHRITRGTTILLSCIIVRTRYLVPGTCLDVPTSHLLVVYLLRRSLGVRPRHFHNLDVGSIQSTTAEPCRADAKVRYTTRMTHRLPRTNIHMHVPPPKVQGVQVVSMIPGALCNQYVRTKEASPRCEEGELARHETTNPKLTPVWSTPSAKLYQAYTRTFSSTMESFDREVKLGCCSSSWWVTCSRNSSAREYDFLTRVLAFRGLKF